MNHYAEVLKTFLFKREWAPVFEAIPDEEAGKLIKAVLAYAEGKEPALDNPIVQSIYVAITAAIDHNALRYLERSGFFDPGESRGKARDPWGSVE